MYVYDYNSSRMCTLEYLASCMTHTEGNSNSIKYSQRLGSVTDISFGSKPQLRCTYFKQLHNYYNYSNNNNYYYATGAREKMKNTKISYLHKKCTRKRQSDVGK